jgi:AcrR family transcriptional regulator
MKNDRRSVRTKAALERSLLALIRRKRYEAITIQDICDAADVGRSTFYAHYQGKDDLKRRGLDHLRDQLIDAQTTTAMSSDARCLRFSLPMFEHARSHLDVYRAMKRNRGGSIALGRIREIICDLVREEIKASTEGRPDIAPELAVQYLVGAYMAVLVWWLDGGAQLAPERVDAMFRQLASTAIAGSTFAGAQ